MFGNKQTSAVARKGNNELKQEFVSGSRGLLSLLPCKPSQYNETDTEKTADLDRKLTAI